LSIDDSLEIKIAICPTSFYEANKAIDKLVEKKENIMEDNAVKIEKLRKLLMKKKEEEELQR